MEKKIRNHGLKFAACFFLSIFLSFQLTTVAQAELLEQVTISASAGSSSIVANSDSVPQLEKLIALFSGIEKAELTVNESFHFINGVTADIQNGVEGTQYYVIVTGVDTPEGGSYTYRVGDTNITPTSADVGKSYLVHYAVQSSTDGGATRFTVSQQNQPENFTRELYVLPESPVTEEASSEESVEQTPIPLDAPTSSTFSLRWMNTESGKELANGYTGTSTDILTPQAQISVSNQSGQPIAEGELTIRIPYVAFRYRANFGQNGQTETGAANGSNDVVPAVYDCLSGEDVESKPVFSYWIDNNETEDTLDDEVVFQNSTTIDMGSTKTISWSYEINPVSVVDLTNFELTATLILNETQLETEPISYEIDTQAGTVEVEKEGAHTEKQDDYFQPAWNVWQGNGRVYVSNSPTGINTESSSRTQMFWGELPSKETYEAHFWHTWRFCVRQETAGNQPGILSITEALPEGAYIHNVYSTAFGNNTAYTIQNNIVSSNYGNASDVIYLTIAYPKAFVTQETISNEAQANYYGIDAQDTPEAQTVRASAQAQISLDNVTKTGAAIYIRPTEIAESDWDIDTYIYAKWTVDVYASGHPSASFSIRDTVLDTGGEVLGIEANDYFLWNSATNTATLKPEVDFLNPFRDSAGVNSFPTISDMDDNDSALAAHYRIIVYTRHTKTNLDENGGKTLQNNAVCTVTPTNTTQEPFSETAQGQFYWRAYQFPANTYRLTKQYLYNYDNDTIGSNNYSQFELDILAAGEDCKFYTPVTYYAALYNATDAMLVMEDTDIQLKLPQSLAGTEQDIPLDEEDYYITQLSHVLTATYYSPNDGHSTNWNTPEEAMPQAPVISLYLEIDNVMQATPFRTGTFGAFSATVSEAEMPQHVTGYRYVAQNVEHTVVSMLGNVYFSLRATSPKIEDVSEAYPQQAHPDLAFYLQNTAKLSVTENSVVLDEQAQTATADLNRAVITHTTYAAKTHSFLGNDTVNQQVNYQYTLSARNTINLSLIGSETMKELFRTGAIPGHLHALYFYDLLPRGMEYNTSYTPTVTANAGANTAHITSVNITNDYKGSGRQMVVFAVELVSDELVNLDSQRYSGFSITFRAAIPWATMNYLENPIRNLAAAQLPAGEAFQNRNNVHADTVLADGKIDSVVSSYHRNVLGTNGLPVFEDLNANGIDTMPNTIYMQSYFARPIVETSLESGLIKGVRTQGDDNNGSYGTSSVVDAGGFYEYRLSLQNADSDRLEQVVLYDVLEEAANGDPAWAGTFDSINVMYPRLLGIDAKVWYYTGTTALTYTTVQASFAAGTGWSLSPPADKTTIQAIAVDLTSKTDGTPYTFAPAATTSVTIKMQAPSSFIQGKAYNRAALDCVTTNVLTSAVTQTYDVGERTSIDLRVLSVLEKIAIPASGISAEHPTMVQPGDVITYTIRFSPSVGEDGTLPRDITVSDTIPDNLLLVEGSVGQNIQGGALKTAGAQATYNATTNTITWPTYTANSMQVSEFTFRAVVVPQTGTQAVLYHNTATVQDGTVTKQTNTTYHQQAYRAQTFTKEARVALEDKTFAEASENGTSESPVVVPVGGREVEYTLKAQEISFSGQGSGRVVMTDEIPEHTNYVSGSANGLITKSQTTSAATLVSVQEITNSDGVVISLQWTFENMQQGDLAIAKFRVTAPVTTDDAETAAWESEKSWQNSAQLLDEGNRDAVYAQTVTVINRDGSKTTHTAGDALYARDVYCIDSNSTYHKVQDLRYAFNLRKQLDKAAQQDVTAIFKIDYMPQGQTSVTKSFYQKVFIPAGQTTASIKISALPAGTYHVTEFDTGWRYALIDSSNTTLVLPDNNNVTAVFTNEYANDRWLSDKTATTNALPKLN